MDEFKLKNPIMVNGEERACFKYDLSELTEENLLHAIALSHHGKENFSGLLETDYSFHVWLMFMAIVKANDDIDVIDLERIKGTDCLALSQRGADFLNENSVPSKGEVEIDGIKYQINAENLTVEMYMDADTDSRKYANSIMKPSIYTAAGDMAFQLFMGYNLIFSSNDDINMEKLRNMKGGNLIKILRTGRNFIFGTLAGDFTTGSQQEKSEKSSEDIPESITAE